MQKSLKTKLSLGRHGFDGVELGSWEPLKRTIGQDATFWRLLGGGELGDASLLGASCHSKSGG